MNKPKQASMHICCDENLANKFKQVVEQNGHTKSLVMRELMQDYINKFKNLDLPAEQEVVSQVLKKGETSALKPLKDMTADDLLTLAIRMAEKHI